jgi:uncharacterized protein YbjT (DUF2867 family)
MDRPIVVSGATGLQGGAVARRLLAEGWRVKFLTRHPNSERARTLSAQGATAIQADLQDLASLRKACRGACGVFSVQDFWEHGHEREIRQGLNLIDAARAEKVEHFVYASVGGVGRTQSLDITHFDTKAVIEAELKRSGLQWTIYRPVTFLENFTMEGPLQRMFRTGTVSFPFPSDRPFQLLAVDDEAALVAAAFQRPAKFAGLELEIASDQRRLDELAAAIATASGMNLTFQEVPMEAFSAFVARTTDAGLTAKTKIGPSLVPQLAWNRASPTGGWNADLAKVRLLHPKLHTVEQWARSIDWTALAEQHGAVLEKARPA